MDRAKVSRQLFQLSVLAYVASFVLPVYPKPFGPGNESLYGYHAFLFIGSSVTDMALNRPGELLTWESCQALGLWCANPLFLLGVIGLLQRRRWLTALAGFTAAALASSFVLDSRSRYGYWAWLLSMVLLGVAGLVRPRQKVLSWGEGGPAGR